MVKNILLIVVLGMIGNWMFGQSNFTKTPEEPVLPRTAVFGAWDAIAVSDPFVISYEDTLKMWYTGVGWLSAADTSIHQRIGYAWSLDGIEWNTEPNPVLDRTPLAWDDLGVETPCVIIDPLAPLAEKYKMWYTGQNSSTGIYNIGYAISSDGIHWTKHPNSVMQIGAGTSWENGFLEGPSVLLVNDTLKMWYASIDLVGNGQPTDFSGNIGFAWSLDGIEWNKHANNPIFASYNSTGWDLVSVADPHVIYNDGQYQMWYAGLNTWASENFKMGYAVSSDGITWTRPTNVPALETGNLGEWDDEDASYGCVIYNAVTDNYEMWYTGIDTNYPSADLSDYYYEIGRAIAPNTVSNIETNPIHAEVSFFPNPFHSKIEILGNSTELQSLQVFDVLGQNVTEDILIMKEGATIIDMSTLPLGVYIITTQNTANRVCKN